MDRSQICNEGVKTPLKVIAQEEIRAEDLLEVTIQS